MSELDAVSVPVFSCAQAREFERTLFDGEESREWLAMQSAGAGVAAAVLRDGEEIGGLPPDARLLVLAGKGHNGGDALIAAASLLRTQPSATADVVFGFGERTLRPLAARAWRELQHAARSRVSVVEAKELVARSGGAAGPAPSYRLCLDGIFGFQFRPPVDAGIRGLIEAVNRLTIGFRAAVDLPSADLLRADFTYATGSVKAPVLASEHAGRVRLVDLGFFGGKTDLALPSAGDASPPGGDRVLSHDILAPLAGFRPARSDKRHYGHVFILGGSRGYPGAVLMGAMAAVRSGAGLVTAFVPESLAPGFAARLPEAIWVGWPETPAGSLALEGEHLLRERIERADALVVGPGMGREPETLALAQSVVASAAIPVVIDADALQRDIVNAGTGPRVVTPHAGEFKRIAGDDDLRTYARDPKLTVVLKGPITRVCNGGPVYHVLAGGPVLARGGSGDLLAGMIGTQVAQSPATPALAAARAALWHATAADRLARARGQVAVATTELLEYLAAALPSA